MSRWIVGILIVVVVVAAIFFKNFRKNPVDGGESTAEVEDSPDGSRGSDRPIDLAQKIENPAQGPDAGSGADSGGAAGIPNAVVTQMKECFDMNTAGDGQEGVSSVDGALDILQRDVGPPIKQGDLWTDWMVRMKDGSDRKVHLENIEDNEGHVRQTIMLFLIDPRGQPFPVPLDPKDRDRPATEVANLVLNQGEVQKKEKASYFQFARGERLEIIDVDGKPTEIEMVRDETLFRCDSLAPKTSCQCIK